MKRLNVNKEIREELIQQIIALPPYKELSEAVKEYREYIKANEPSHLSIFNNTVYKDITLILASVYCYLNEIEAIDLDTLDKINNLTYNITLWQLVNL